MDATQPYGKSICVCAAHARPAARAAADTHEPVPQRDARERAQLQRRRARAVVVHDEQVPREHEPHAPRAVERHVEVVAERRAAPAARPRAAEAQQHPSGGARTRDRRRRVVRREAHDGRAVHAHEHVPACHATRRLGRQRGAAAAPHEPRYDEVGRELQPQRRAVQRRQQHLVAARARRARRRLPCDARRRHPQQRSPRHDQRGGASHCRRHEIWGLWFSECRLPIRLCVSE